MPATTAKQLANASGRLDATLSDAYDRVLEAELIVRQMQCDPANDEAHGYGCPVSPERAFILRAAGFDPDNRLELQKHFGRIDAERRQRLVAGDANRLREVAARHEAALASERNGELAKVIAEIAALEKRREALEKVNNDALREYTAVVQARENLTKLLPPFLQAQIDVINRRAFAQSDAAARVEILGEAQMIVDDFVNATGPNGTWTALEGVKLAGKA